MSISRNTHILPRREMRKGVQDLKRFSKIGQKKKTILVVSYLCVPKHPTDVCTILFVASIYTVVLEHLLYFYELFRSVGTLDHQTLSNASMNCQNHFIGFKLP